jgi:beta-glucanase (GH16 family)
VANTSSLPFNQPFFLLLNQAMGGNFGGAIDPAFNSATFEIDYVRVYQ